MEILKYVNNISRASLLDSRDFKFKNFDIRYIDLSELNLSSFTLPDVLSSDEKQKAESFKNAEKKRRYLVSRTVLRLILSTYLHINPKNITFSYSKNSKPKALNKSGQEFFFNISHSKNITIFAFSHKYELGVDIEYIDETKDIKLIVDRFFSKKERKFIFSKNKDERVEFFFRLWVVKEAYLKGADLGIDDLREAGVVYKDSNIYMYDEVMGGHLKDWGFVTMVPKDHFIACLAFKFR